MVAVELRGVTKRYGDTVAVEDLDLEIPERSIWGFVGPNGSGKTTTLRMILRIVHPDAGEIRVLGGAGPGAADDRVGYLPEERGLYRKMKAREAIRFHAALKGSRIRARRADEMLERFGLGGWGDKSVEALSKGMAQKLQFLAAVAHGPSLVVLDEPLGGLDPVSAAAIEEAILALRDQGATVILSTHDMDSAERLCGSILMIHRGRKVLDGTLESIKAAHGARSLRVRVADPDRPFRDIHGVEEVREDGRLCEIRLSPSADPQEILAALAAAGRVEHFEIGRPSLRDIFIEIAGPGTERGGEGRP